MATWHISTHFVVEGHISRQTFVEMAKKITTKYVNSLKRCFNTRDTRLNQYAIQVVTVLVGHVGDLR